MGQHRKRFAGLDRPAFLVIASLHQAGHSVSLSVEIASQSQLLGPILIRTDWKWLIGTEIGGTDGGEHELFRWNWAARQPT